MGHSRVLSVLKCSNTCERPPDICARLSCAPPPPLPPSKLGALRAGRDSLRPAPSAVDHVQEHETPGLAEFLQDRDLSRKIA